MKFQVYVQNGAAKIPHIIIPGKVGSLTVLPFNHLYGIYDNKAFIEFNASQSRTFKDIFLNYAAVKSALSPISEM